MPFPKLKPSISLKMPGILAGMKDDDDLKPPKLKKARVKLTPASASRIRAKAKSLMGMNGQEEPD